MENMTLNRRIGQRERYKIYTMLKKASISISKIKK